MSMEIIPHPGGPALPALIAGQGTCAGPKQTYSPCDRKCSLKRWPPDQSKWFLLRSHILRVLSARRARRGQVPSTSQEELARVRPCNPQGLAEHACWINYTCRVQVFEFATLGVEADSWGCRFLCFAQNLSRTSSGILGPFLVFW
jgi:hypothetical protein